jgi:hypothetical protein
MMVFLYLLSVVGIDYSTMSDEEEKQKMIGAKVEDETLESPE